MKKYEDPELEIIRFNDADIIVTSGGCGGAGCPFEAEEEDL